MSTKTFQDTLKHPPPYPTIVLPPSGGYWVESADSLPDNDEDGEVNIEVDETARIYRAHFLGYEHYNFYGTDEQVFNITKRRIPSNYTSYFSVMNR